MTWMAGSVWSAPTAYSAKQIKPTKPPAASPHYAAQGQRPTPATEPPQRGPTPEDMNAASQMAPEDRQAMIRNMVQGLVERLKKTPNDLNGWMMLERSYRVMGDTVRADEVAQRIKAMDGTVR